MPKSYLFLEKCFIDEINKFNKNNLIKMYEYKREDWTFHTKGKSYFKLVLFLSLLLHYLLITTIIIIFLKKGLWYYFNNNKYPSLTLIGSSNYGYRSIKRDLELQNILITSNKNLQNLLHKVIYHFNHLIIIYIFLIN